MTLRKKIRLSLLSISIVIQSGFMDSGYFRTYKLLGGTLGAPQRLTTSTDDSFNAYLTCRSLYLAQVMLVNRPQCTYPPTDYCVTLPEVVDFHRQHNPNETSFVFSADDACEPTKISYLEFGRAADRVAHHIRPGRGGKGRQVVAIVALCDTLLYQAITLGITRAGYIPYPISPRNTAAAIIKLLKDTFCHRVLTTYETLGNLVDEVTEKLVSTDPTYKIVVDEVPPLFEIFPNLGAESSNDPFEDYPIGARPCLDEVLLYLHSSGSTGFPKTIPQTFRSMVHWAGLAPVTDNITHRTPLIMASHALPPFHTLGIIAQLLVSMYAMTPVGLYPPIATAPKATPMVPTPNNIIEHARRTRCNCLMIVPTILQLWAQDPDVVAFLSTLEYVGYAGGSLPAKLGNSLSDAGIYLISAYGGTEFGGVAKFFRRKGEEKDWEWIRLAKGTSAHWDAQGDDTFELHLLTTERHQVSVENIPNARGYATSDLWVRHPSKPDVWKIIGRKDDVIVHTSGEKTVPAPLESIMMSSKYIMSAIMFGRERDNAGVLIELKSEYAIDTADLAAVANVRNILWPIIQEANKGAPVFSRISKDMILIFSRDKPLPRAGKGTVLRKAALVQYAKEIEKIYVDAIANKYEVSPPRSWAICDVETWLSKRITELHSGQHFDALTDLFQQGMDSLRATILCRQIVAAMQSEESRKAAKSISQATIYRNPTIKRLSEFLSEAVTDPANCASPSGRVEAIEAMITKYSSGLAGSPMHQCSNAALSVNGHVVLLTGTTGNLGAHLLRSLLESPQVQRVYALNRPSSQPTVIHERQKNRFIDQGLDAAILDSGKLVFLGGDSTQEKLGLGDAKFDELRRTVTLIIHNAWRLDFNLPLSAFEPNIKGTRNLIDLALLANNAKMLKFLFTSSVSSAYAWDKTKGAYPEEIVENAKYAVGNGYGESKYVAEMILARSGLNATSFRIGQIAGGLPSGAWATTDWVPILVKSSLHLNAFPSARGMTSWLPMSAVAQILLDVAWSSITEPALNVVHPSPISWDTMFDLINRAIVAEGLSPTKLPLVTFEKWMSHLEVQAEISTPEALASIPAIKLLDFFRCTSDIDASLPHVDIGDMETGGLPTFVTSKVQAVSQTMQYLPSIDAGDAQRWVRYWKSSGFFDRAAEPVCTVLVSV